MLDHVIPLVPVLLWLVCDGLVHWPWLQAGWSILTTPQPAPSPGQRSTAATAPPECPACAAAVDGEAPAPAPSQPPPRIEQQRGHPRTVDISNHYCPPKSCSYSGWVGLGNIRSNGHPNGGWWRQLECIVCGKTFMEAINALFYGKPKPRWQPLSGLQYAQVVKQRVKGRVVGVTHRGIYGSLEWVTALIEQRGVGQVINTAFIERPNLSIRQPVAALGRQVTSLAKKVHDP